MLAHDTTYGDALFSFLEYRGHYSRQFVYRQSRRLSVRRDWQQHITSLKNSRLPNVGDTVTAFDGTKGEVASVNVLRQYVKLIVTDDEDNKELVEYKISELKYKPHKRRQDDKKIDDRELKALEALERSETGSKLNDE